MIDKIPTVRELGSYPQLAIVDALERTLRLASFSLLAAYQDPDVSSPVEENSAEEAYAQAALNQITALEITLTRYRETVEYF